MTITEFLEARIAEDEAAAGKEYTWESPEWRITEWEANDSCGLDIPPSRLRAECAAKRSILAMHQTYVLVASGFREAEFGRDLMADVLERLAAVYKDHPDYRQEWAL